MQLCSRLTNFCLLLWLFVMPVSAQQTYPQLPGERVRYDITIDMERAHVSGIMIMHRSADDVIDASIINEFGISLMDFSYNERKGKVKFHSLMSALDHWYIKATLKGDLKKIMAIIKDGGTEYVNSKRHIKYTFHLIAPAAADDSAAEPSQDETQGQSISY